MRVKQWWTLLKNTGTSWSEDDATRLSAALAFYTVLSIAPLLVIAVAVAGWFLGDEAARGQIAGQLSAIMGPEPGEGVEALLKNAKEPTGSVLSSIIGVVVLIFGASGVFGELQKALNTIWEVEPRPGRGIWGFVRDRFFSFSLVLGVAFLLLVSLTFSAVLSALGKFLESSLPGGETLWQIINFVVSFGIITALFALLLRVVPDIKASWRGIWPGAVVTALLFTVGKFGLGLYLGRASVSSPYGAAGSIVVLVIWVYYAAQIFFLGAEFTREYIRAKGMKVRPARDAVPAKDADGQAPAGGAEPHARGPALEASVPARSSR